MRGKCRSTNCFLFTTSPKYGPATYLYVLLFTFQSTFGQGSGSVWLDEVECTGDERELDECAHREYGDVVNCRGHSRDAGVACSGKVVTSRPFFKPS